MSTYLFPINRLTAGLFTATGSESSIKYLTRELAMDLPDFSIRGDI